MVFGESLERGLEERLPSGKFHEVVNGNENVLGKLEHVLTIKNGELDLVRSTDSSHKLRPFGKVCGDGLSVYIKGKTGSADTKVHLVVSRR